MLLIRICQAGFPELPEDAELYYSDSRNLVYRSPSAEYRYIGNFHMKDKELERFGKVDHRE